MRRLGIAVASALVAARSANPAPAPPRIHISVAEHPRTSVAPLYVAADAGLFAEEGLDVTLRRIEVSSAASLAALVKGDLDVDLSGPSARLLNAIARGANFRVVAGEGYLDPGACPQFGWVVRRDWIDANGHFDPKRLRGARARYDPISSVAFETTRALAPYGLTLDDFQKAAVPNDMVEQAVVRGDLDFAYLPSVALTRALATGRVALWKRVSDVMPNAQIYSLVFGSRLLGPEREGGIRFLVAYLRAVRMFQAPLPDRIVDILARRYSISPAEVRASCWPSFRADGRIENASWSEFQEWARAQDALDRVVKPAEFLNESLLAEANRRLEARKP